jgi:hypothetical protein
MCDKNGELQRVLEIKTCAIKLDSPKAFFQHDDDKLENPAKRPLFIELEGDLQALDLEAWKHLKSEICDRLKQKTELRGWQQLIDILNEAKGYRYLASIGCTDVAFIPRSKAKTPDLKAVRGNIKVLCDVKTINISDDEAVRRFVGGVGTTLAQLPEGFFRKLLSHLETASAQMRTFNPEDDVQRVVYLVVNTDDCFNEYADAYRSQIENYLAHGWSADVEVILDIKSAFSSVQITAHKGRE